MYATTQTQATNASGLPFTSRFTSSVAVYPDPVWVVKPRILSSFGKNVLSHQPFTDKSGVFASPVYLPPRDDLVKPSRDSCAEAPLGCQSSPRGVVDRGLADFGAEPVRTGPAPVFAGALGPAGLPGRADGPCTPGARGGRGPRGLPASP